MVTERQVWHTMPPEQVRTAWAAWVRLHGIDPTLVTIPGWVERDAQRRQVRYQAYTLNHRGHVHADASGQAAATHTAVQQLEAEPSPFPLT